MLSARGLLFDHDGTLVDTLGVVVQATNAVLAARGAPTRDAVTIVAGMVLPTAERMGALLGITDAAQQRALAQAYYAAAEGLTGMATVYAGVAALLGRAARVGRQIAVVSNNQSAFCRAVLHQTGLGEHISLVLGEDSMPATKPAPDGLLQAMRGLGLSTAQCVFIGDSSADSRAAAAAGITSIGVAWGTHTVDELRAAGFDHIVRDAVELGRLVGLGEG